MRITVIGGGYVGLVTGACLAETGHDVTIVDVDPHKIKKINEKNAPMYEEGLEILLIHNVGIRLRASLSYDSIITSDLTFICVGTPPNDNGSANLTYIESASISIGNALQQTESYHVVVVKSTVPPGTTENLIRPLILKSARKTENEIGFVMNPEFLREGRAVADFMQPNRIVIGSNDKHPCSLVAELYKPLRSPFVFTSLPAAEMIKYASNAFLATKISFSNEIGNICKQLNIDVYEVMKGVGLDHRIGQQFLNAGVGFGGSCFSKDISSLITLAETAGINPTILRSVLEVNKTQPHRMISRLENKIGNLSGMRIAVLGLAFKDNTDDVRDSRAIPVIEELIAKGAHVAAYDPMAIPQMSCVFPSIEYCSCAANALKGADGCLVMTEWPEFKDLDHEFDGMKRRIIIEGRRILSCKDRNGICW